MLFFLKVLPVIVVVSVSLEDVFAVKVVSVIVVIGVVSEDCRVVVNAETMYGITC